MKTVFRKHKLNVLEWPGNLPDLNPVENLWAIIKSRLQKLDCTTMTKLVEAIIQVWFRDPQIIENCLKLVESMPRREMQVLKSKSGHISY